MIGGNKMRKAINIENTSKDIARVLSIADESLIDENPTTQEYILITDYMEPPALSNSLSINYPMYDKVNKVFKWIQITYQHTATEELFQIENLKAESSNLKSQLAIANDNINMLLELQADLIGGAI
jgi:hypothetical protein